MSDVVSWLGSLPGTYRGPTIDDAMQAAFEAYVVWGGQLPYDEFVDELERAHSGVLPMMQLMDRDAGRHVWRLMLPSYQMGMHRGEAA